MTITENEHKRALEGGLCENRCKACLALLNGRGDKECCSARCRRDYSGYLRVKTALASRPLSTVVKTRPPLDKAQASATQPSAPKAQKQPIEKKPEQLVPHINTPWVDPRTPEQIEAHKVEMDAMRARIEANSAKYAHLVGTEADRL